MALLASLTSVCLLPHASHRRAGVPLRSATSCCLADVELDQLMGQTSPVALAYIGDAVWELEVRKRLLWPPRKIGALNAAVVSHTCAEGQSVTPHVEDGAPPACRCRGHVAGGVGMRQPGLTRALRAAPPPAVAGHAGPGARGLRADRD